MKMAIGQEKIVLEFDPSEIVKRLKQFRDVLNELKKENKRAEKNLKALKK